MFALPRKLSPDEEWGFPWFSVSKKGVSGYAKQRLGPGYRVSHSCPGLAMGSRAAKIGLWELKEERAADKELVAVVEADACGVDAIQLLTGCTMAAQR